MQKQDFEDIQKKLKQVFDVSVKKCVSGEYSGETVPLSGIAAAEAAKAIVEIEKIINS